MMVTSSAKVVGAGSVCSTTGRRGAAERISVAIEAAESPGFVVGNASTSPCGAPPGSTDEEPAFVEDSGTATPGTATPGETNGAGLAVTASKAGRGGSGAAGAPTDGAAAGPFGARAGGRGGVATGGGRRGPPAPGTGRDMAGGAAGAAGVAPGGVGPVWRRGSTVGAHDVPGAGPAGGRVGPPGAAVRPIVWGGRAALGMAGDAVGVPGRGATGGRSADGPGGGPARVGVLVGAGVVVDVVGPGGGPAAPNSEPQQAVQHAGPLGGGHRPGRRGGRGFTEFGGQQCIDGCGREIGDDGRWCHGRCLATQAACHTAAPGPGSARDRLACRVAILGGDGSHEEAGRRDRAGRHGAFWSVSGPGPAGTKTSAARRESTPFRWRPDHFRRGRIGGDRSGGQGDALGVRGSEVASSPARMPPGG